MRLRDGVREVTSFVRVLLALGVVAVGFSIALLFGPTFGLCLGLSTTPISCALTSGISPEIGYGPAILALTVSVALLVLLPVDRGRRLRAAVAGAIGFGLGAAGYAVFGARTMEGLSHADIRSLAPDSPAPVWTVIERPLDVSALVFAAVIVAGIATTIVGHWPERSSDMPRAVASASLIALPVIGLGLLFAAGDQVNACLALSGCDALPPPPPVLMSTANVLVVVGVLGVVWLAVLLAASWGLWRHERRQLVRLLAAVAVLATLSAALVGGVAVVEGERLRQVAFNAVVAGVVLAAVLLTVGIARAVAMRRPRTSG